MYDFWWRIDVLERDFVILRESESATLDCSN